MSLDNNAPGLRSQTSQRPSGRDRTNTPTTYFAETNKNNHINHSTTRYNDTTHLMQRRPLHTMQQELPYQDNLMGTAPIRSKDILPTTHTKQRTPLISASRPQTPIRVTEPLGVSCTFPPINVQLSDFQSYSALFSRFGTDLIERFFEISYEIHPKKVWKLFFEPFFKVF